MKWRLTKLQSTTPEEQALSYIDSGGELTESEADKIFNALEPLPSREFLFGSWNGGCFETGHPGCKALIESKWAGKDFRGIDDVDPIMTFDDKGGRFWNEEWGHASVSRSRMISLPIQGTSQAPILLSVETSDAYLAS